MHAMKQLVPVLIVAATALCLSAADEKPKDKAPDPVAEKDADIKKERLIGTWIGERKNIVELEETNTIEFVQDGELRALIWMEAINTTTSEKHRYTYLVKGNWKLTGDALELVLKFGKKLEKKRVVKIKSLSDAELVAEDDKGKIVLKKLDVDNVQKLIEQLGDKDFRKREEAQAKLKGMGESLLDLLTQAREGTTSPEVQKRLGKLIEDANPQPKAVLSAVAPDGKSTASAVGNDVSITDTATGKEIRRIHANPEKIKKGTAILGPVRSIAWSKDGKTITSQHASPIEFPGAHDGAVNVCQWDAATGKLLFRR